VSSSCQVEKHIFINIFYPSAFAFSLDMWENRVNNLNFNESEVMALLTNKEVQDLLTHAISIVETTMTEKTDEFATAKLTLIRSTLVLFKLSSASSNGIPALSGLGLRETVKLAQAIIEAGSIDLRNVNFQFASIAGGLKLEKRG